MVEIPDNSPFWVVLEKRLGKAFGNWVKRDFPRLKEMYAEYRGAADVRESYALLRRFQVALYLTLYQSGYEIGKTDEKVWPKNPDFAAVRTEIKAELVRLTEAIIASTSQQNGGYCNYSFSQGDLLEQAGIKSAGVCNALCLDWLRRHNFNAMPGVIKPKQGFDRPEKQVSLIRKAAGMQEISGGPAGMDKMEDFLNAESAKKKLPQQEGVAQPDNKAAVETAKGFMTLHRMVQKPIKLNDNEKLLRKFAQCLDAQEHRHYPRCIYLSLTRLRKGDLQGHACALFQSTPESPYLYFDPNHGEYSIPLAQTAAFVVEWFELYRPLGMAFCPIFFLSAEAAVEKK